MTDPKLKRVVLCVDDNTEVLQALRRQLRAGLGGAARIELANSAERALERLSHLNADDRAGLVVVSDWLMPGLRGDEFVTELESRFGPIPVIVLSGHITLDARENLGSYPQVLSVMPKPWSEAELLKVVHNGLDLHSPRRLE